MARIKLGPVITDISGSVGGATFQRGRFGHIMRSRPLPLDKNTTLQQRTRASVVKAQTFWQALPSAERLQWERFMDFSGQTIRRDRSVLLSGHALYLKYQVWLDLVGEDVLETIQYIPMPEYPKLNAINHDVGDFYLKFDFTVENAEVYFICKLTSPRLASQAFSYKGLRFMRVTYKTDDEYSINIPYIAAFGVMPATDAYLHYSIQWFSTLSPIFSGTFTGIMQITAP